MNKLAMDLSPAAIRYLLVINDLSSGGLAVRSVDIAKSLSVTPSSVVHMLGVLCRQGLTAKRHYGNVQLTPLGAQTARHLQAQVNGLERFFSRFLRVDHVSARADALNCLCTLSQESIDRMLDRVHVPEQSLTASIFSALDAS